MKSLQKRLLLWYETHQRDLPWRSDPTPYHVWLSEIILQQTRVSQGLGYYVRFLEKWPSVLDLANASEEEVLKMWQGLGYYSRARNLYRCALQVATQYGGSFPADYTLLRKLQGIGDYTAAAIASIAFNLPYAVVDGNVYRVLSRLFDIDTPINKTEGVRLFADLAMKFLDREHPGRHNQALMDFGAIQCTPQKPDCLHCPLQANCLAFAQGTVNERPNKEKKAKIRTRYFNYLVFTTNDDGIYLHKRSGNDIWKHLYDFPLIETEEPISTEALLDTDYFKSLTSENEIIICQKSPQYKHKLTHQTIIATYYLIKISYFLSSIQTKDILLVPQKEIRNFPIPILIDNYLSTINL